MPSELSISATYAGGLRMTATNGVHSVTMDYPLEPGDPGAGLRPMEMVLASLAACAGSVVGSLLARAKQPVTGVSVEARGQRRDEHPTVFTTIAMEFVVTGTDVDPDIVRRVVEQAERICPVWAMLRAGTPIVTSVRLVEGAGLSARG